MTSHCVPAVVAFRHEGVVSAAQQADVCDAVVPTEAERMPMMKLEAFLRGTPSALPVHVAALVSVAHMHGAPDGRGDVARGGR